MASLPQLPTTTRFDPARTALLVIDPVNDFLHEDGAAWEMTKSTVKKNNVVAQLARLTAAAREAGVPVLFGAMAYTGEDYAHHALQRRSGINRESSAALCPSGPRRRRPTLRAALPRPGATP